MAGRNHRVTLRFSEEELGMIDYWAKRRGTDRNGFLVEAVERYAGIESGNYRLPSLEALRMNQLVDMQDEMRSMIARIVVLLEGNVPGGYGRGSYLSPEAE